MKAISITSFILIIAVGLIFWGRSGSLRDITNTPLAQASVTVHRAENCGCCELYVEYLKRLGLEIEDHIVGDIEDVKHQYNIPNDMWSCHTSEFDSYIVEGHIPIEAVEKLFTEQPDFRGIAMPGMPLGSPGMGGSKQKPFEIFALSGGEVHHWQNF